MGYDIHITRRASWSSEKGPPISLEEWQAIIAEDPDLEPYSDGRSAQMVDPSRVAARNFYFSDGQIFVLKPNRPVLMKMLSIARRLGARVMGENDEVYFSDGTPDRPPHPGYFQPIEDWDGRIAPIPLLLKDSGPPPVTPPSASPS